MRSEDEAFDNSIVTINFGNRGGIVAFDIGSLIVVFNELTTSHLRNGTLQLVDLRSILLSGLVELVSMVRQLADTLLELSILGGLHLKHHLSIFKPFLQALSVVDHRLAGSFIDGDLAGHLVNALILLRNKTIETL